MRQLGVVGNTLTLVARLNEHVPLLLTSKAGSLWCGLTLVEENHGWHERKHVSGLRALLEGSGVVTDDNGELEIVRLGKQPFPWHRSSSTSISSRQMKMKNVVESTPANCVSHFSKKNPTGVPDWTNGHRNQPRQIKVAERSMWPDKRKDMDCASE
eukprot:scaffold291560_cov31-Tisochrysis_lutea.AAC.2